MFENGKIAMIFDGEWRTAFIGRDVPKFGYDTVPFPAADSSVYGSGRVGGTVVGIPKGAPHPQQAWLLVNYLSTDTNYLVTMANALGNVPTTTASANSPDLKQPRQFTTSRRCGRTRPRRSPRRCRPSGGGYVTLVTAFESTSGSPARSPSRLHDALVQLDHDIDNQLAAGARRRRRSRPTRRSSASHAGRAPACEAERVAAPLRHRAGDAVAVDRRLLLFTAGPMLISFYYSFTHYDLTSSPRWIGLANYQFMFQHATIDGRPDQGDPVVWQAVKNTAWIIVFALPLRVLFAMGTAMLLTRPRRGVNGYRTLFFMPSLAPTVGATLVFVYLLNPTTGPINTFLDSDPRDLGAAVVHRSPLGQTGAGDARAVGRRRRDHPLPGRPAERAARAVRGDHRRGRRAPGSGSGTSPCR